MPRFVAADSGLQPVYREIEKRHDASLRRLQAWIRQPSIAAENCGIPESCRLPMDMLRQAGFDQVIQVRTDGQPGVFATLDAGAPKTIGLYFMYDVKQVDFSAWSSPPFDAALHAIKAAGRKPPVNFVFGAKVSKRSARRIFRRSCAAQKFRRRYDVARAYSCLRRRRMQTAR